MHRQMVWCLTQIKLFEVLELNDLPDLRKFEGLHSCMFIAENCLYCMHTDRGIYRKAAKEAKSKSR